MERLRSDESWFLFNPIDVPGLLVTHGGSFTAQYEQYTRMVEPVSVVQARDLWASICRAQQESGGPFLLYQDSINCESAVRCNE